MPRRRLRAVVRLEVPGPPAGRVDRWVRRLLAAGRDAGGRPVTTVAEARPAALRVWAGREVWAELARGGPSAYDDQALVDAVRSRWAAVADELIEGATG